MSDRVNYTMPQTQYEAIKSLIVDLDNEIIFGVDLDSEERGSLPKTGDKSLAFVRAAAGLVDMAPDFLPRSFNIPEFQQDVALMEKLVDLNRRLERTAQRVNDTLLAVGSEAYLAALVVYKNAKDNGQGAELDNAVDEMGKRFIKKSRLDPKPPTA
jgi:hypothetical protein